MRSVRWRVEIREGKIAILEEGIGFPLADVESHLTLIGILEDIKQKHLDKLKTIYQETIKK